MPPMIGQLVRLILLASLAWQIRFGSSFSFTTGLTLHFRHGCQRHKSRLRNQLNTAVEWLCEERYETNAAYYQSIEWYDPSQPLSLECDENEEMPQTMPLYPLGATYLPAPNVNHTLNNVEPRNVKMALDLLDRESKDSSEEPLFCVVLSAADTGRIASVGTILKIVDSQIQQDYEDPNRVARIRLTCQAQCIADIRAIENPEAFSKENRIRRSSEYLKARVHRRNDKITEHDHDSPNKQKHLELSQQLIADFPMVQLLYQLDIGGADPTNALPPSALPQLGNAMPSWKESRDFAENLDDFWKAAQDWQSVCYTIRQGRQSMINTERNERMISAATAKGGPLKLPIHMEDLDPEERREIQELENESYKDYLKLDMEPCLDFQALISLSSHSERMELLSQMISRERKRLEALANQPRDAKGDDTDLSFEF